MTPKPKPSQQTRAQQTRQRILEAAADCFREKGVRDSSIEAIAKQAGSTKPTVYAHFGTKTALFNAVALATAAELKERTLPPFDPNADLAKQLTRIFTDYLATMLNPQNLKLYRAILFELASDETAEAPEYETGYDYLRVWLQDAQAKGAALTGDLAQASQMLWAAVKGQLFYPVLLGLEQPNPDTQTQELQAIVVFCLRAIQPSD
ncbi:MAG: TetR/AcrR family transcriptional regulator [Spirulina sp. SIO3F2]|nr:TetR/AcrR family transcriptional regulator [Spirulina sp. SIO3F2]